MCDCDYRTCDADCGWIEDEEEEEKHVFFFLYPKSKFTIQTNIFKMKIHLYLGDC